MGRCKCRRRKPRKKTRRKRKKTQRGGALFHRRPTLQDKIAEGASMLLSGPAPTFLSLGGKLMGQAFKGLKDNAQPGSLLWKLNKGRR